MSWPPGVILHLGHKKQQIRTVGEHKTFRCIIEEDGAVNLWQLFPHMSVETYLFV